MVDAKQAFYGLAALIGLCANWYFNVQVFTSDDEATFLGLAYSNPASASLTNDLLVVGAVFFVWSWFEARRLSMKHWWVYVVMTFGVAIAVAYPNFLLMRERAMVRAA